MAISLTFLFLLYFSAINILCYQNPTQRMFDSPDPGVFRDSDGSFYAITTGGLNDKIFPMWKSKDMGSWLYVGSILDQAPAWTDGGDFWAP
jgi:beta-xylosidase